MLQLASLIPMIVGISQAIKNCGVPGRFIPLINIFTGILISFFFFSDLGIADSILFGIVAGLSAAGLYDQSKNVATSISSTLDHRENK